MTLPSKNDSSRGSAIPSRFGFHPSREAVERLASDIDAALPQAKIYANLAQQALEKGTPPATMAGQMLAHAAQALADQSLGWLSQTFAPDDLIGLLRLPPTGGAPEESKCGRMSDAEFVENLRDWLIKNVAAGSIYIHTNPLLHEPARHKATDNDIAARRHVVLDFDDKDFLRDRSNPDWAAARREVETLVNRVTTLPGAEAATIVISGGGMHVWFRVEDAPAEYNVVWNRICRLISSDSVGDPSRIMRLPFTLNVPSESKRALGRDIALCYPTGPIRFDKANDAVMLAEVIEAGFPGADRQPRRVPKVVPTPPGNEVEKALHAELDVIWPEIGNISELDEHDPIRRERLKTGLMMSRGLMRRWHGDADGLEDGSASGFTMALIGAAKAAGLSFQDSAALAVVHEYGELLPGVKLDDAGRKRQIVRCWTRTLAEAPSAESDPARNRACGRRQSAVQAAVAMVQANGAELWATPGGEACMTLASPSGDVEHQFICSGAGELALMGAVKGYSSGELVLTRKQAKEVAEILEAHALVNPGACCEAEVRSASHQGKIYLDLGGRGTCIVEVDGEGWRLIAMATCPVRFVRPRGMLPLPEPRRDGHGQPVVGLLRRHVNLPVRRADTAYDPGVRAEAVLIAGLAAGIRREGPLPHLALTGPAGSGKSSAARRLKGIWDPHDDMLIPMPKDTAGLYIAARAQGVLALDNLSSIKGDFSDALCMLGTGGSLVNRKLYSDGDTASLKARKQVFMTSVAHGLCERSDLLDRVFSLELAPLTGRRSESDLDKAWMSDHPTLLAAFLDALANGLAMLPQVARDLAGTALPRMVDAAIFGEAVARGLGWPPGLLIESLMSIQSDAQLSLAEMDPIVMGLRKLLRQFKGTWEGTMSEMLDLLRHHGLSQDIRSARGLGAHLARIDGPVAAAAGLKIERLGRESSTKRASLVRVTISGDVALEMSNDHPF